MTEEQQVRIVALLLALAFDATCPQAATIKKELAKLPEEIVARAAGTPIQFE
jgi:hypothetical protein